MSNTIEVRLFEPAELTPSPVNKRAFYKDDAKDPYIVDLAKSIKEDGQLEEILVRPVNGHHEIVYGECRVRACRLNGMKVSAKVKQLDDKQAAIITAVENAKRKNLNPIEEAETMEACIGLGWTHTEIADHLKVPLSHVIKRVQLTQLSPKWREIATDAESFAHAWNGVHFEKIAKFPRDVQDGILQNLKEYDLQDVSGWTTKMLATHLAQFLQSIDNAPWKKDDETLVVKAGACKACKKRSDCQPDLFDDEDLIGMNEWGQPTGKVKKGARCLDRDCWDSKMAAYLTQREAELKEKHNKAPMILANNEYRVNHSKDHPYKGRAKADWDVTPCKESDKGAVAALYVDGPKTGQVTYVRARREESNYPDNRAKAKQTGDKASLKEKRANLELLRARLIFQNLAESIQTLAGDDDEAISTLVCSPVMVTQKQMLAFVSVFGTDGRHPNLPITVKRDKGWARFSEVESMAALPEDRNIFHLFGSALRVLAADLRAAVINSQMTKKLDTAFAEQACKFIGWNFDKFRKEAVEAKPEPKSWAKGETEAKEPKKTAKAKADAKPKRNGNAKPTKKPAKAKAKKKAAK